MVPLCQSGGFPYKEVAEHELEQGRNGHRHRTRWASIGSIRPLCVSTNLEVAPGIVDTPLQKDDPKDFLKTLSPIGTIVTSEEIASAVVYLTESRQITGEVLHVDGAAHNGKW